MRLDFSTTRVPFSNLSRDGWRRLGFLAVAVIYIVNLLFSLVKLGLFNGVGGDYFPFLTAGKVIDLFGYSHLFDVFTIQKVQSAQLAELGFAIGLFEPHPSPYFPIFMAPFKYISRIDMRVSFWMWTILTFIILVGYLFSFCKRLNRLTNIQSNIFFLMFPILFCYPVYTSFLYGQPEVFLLIFTGEFLLSGYKKKSFVSGLWLGMLFIKPQVLLLIIPALIIQRNLKILAGCLVTAGAIVVSSTILVGLDGMIDLFHLWFSYAPDTDFFSPNGMANWRMLASNLNQWTNSFIGWVFAGVGMVLTLIIWFGLTWKNYPLGTNAWVFNFGAIFAASLALTWHSHIHMGMVLIPFLIFLFRMVPAVGRKVFDLWFFLFPLALIGSYLLAGAFNLLLEQPDLVNTIGGFLLGLTGLGLYIGFCLLGYRIPATSEIRPAEFVE